CSAFLTPSVFVLRILRHQTRVQYRHRAATGTTSPCPEPGDPSPTTVDRASVTGARPGLGIIDIVGRGTDPTRHRESRRHTVQLVPVQRAEPRQYPFPGLVEEHTNGPTIVGIGGPFDDSLLLRPVE